MTTVKSRISFGVDEANFASELPLQAHHRPSTAGTVVTLHSEVANGWTVPADFASACTEDFATSQAQPEAPDDSATDLTVIEQALSRFSMRLAGAKCPSVH